MVFTGTYEHSIDAKNRLAIPSEIRQLVQDEVGRTDRPVGFYVTLGEGQALCLYTEPGFEKRAAELDSSELNAEDLLAYERLMFSLSRRVELDKQGRVLLPENLIAEAGLGPDVVLLGVKDHLEIRDRAAWREYVRKIRAERPQLLMNPRRAMRATPSAMQSPTTPPPGPAPGAGTGHAAQGRDAAGGTDAAAAGEAGV